jgi:phosphoglycolate phosphatase
MPNRPAWPRAVLFDLDGTLVDSAADIAEALNELLQEHGRAPYAVAEVKRMVGNGVHRLVERAFADGADANHVDVRAARFVDLYEPRATHLSELVEGAADVVASLREAGVPMAVCTNKPDAASHVILRNLGLLDAFDIVVGGSSGLPRKPDPATLLHAANALGAQPHETLMVGDSGPDVAAARAAGMTVVALDSGYGDIPALELGADLVLGSLRDLPDALVFLGHIRQSDAQA